MSFSIENLLRPTPASKESKEKAVKTPKTDKVLSFSIHNLLRPTPASKEAGKARRKRKAAYLRPIDEDYINFNNQLRAVGLMLREVVGDGNCLFRALGDQLEGHQLYHQQHRMDTVAYIIQHRAMFEPFIAEPFHSYVNNLNCLGTYAGQNVLVAFARMHRVNIVIHQLNRAVLKIVGNDDGVAFPLASSSGTADIREMHVSYHNGEHYNSVRLLGDHTNTPADIHVSMPVSLQHYSSVRLHGDNENTPPDVYLSMRLPAHANTNSGNVVASCCLGCIDPRHKHRR